MLVRDDGSGWTAITQPAHAWLAAEVARAWDGPGGPPSAATVLGIEQHDVAWRDWDRAPSLHAEAGRPASFLEADRSRRLAIWHDVAQLVEAQDPYAAVLVSLHATNIHTRYVPEELRSQELLAGAAADQERLLAVLPDVDRAQAERDGELLFVLDALSLSVCHRWPGRDLPALPDGTVLRLEPAGEGAWTLDPWPLAADELQVSLPVRTSAARFDDETALREAFAALPVRREPVRLVRP